MLKGKNIVLAVTGSIAAYKIANLASMLGKLHAKVTVLMTANATNFINPITFETLTGNKCLIDTFDRNFQYNVEHVSLAKETDLVLVAPASANVIGKIANGIADDMLTTTVMACSCKKIIAPAMNTHMYLNPIVQDNMDKLRRFGMEVITPDTGHLACGDDGIGKMPSEQVLLDYILREIAFEKDLAGKKVLVTAGATMEKIYIQPFHRENGLCHCRECHVKRCRCNIDYRKVRIDTAAFCQCCAGDFCTGYVRCGQRLHGRTGYYHQSGSRCRLPSGKSGRGKDKEAGR